MAGVDALRSLLSRRRRRRRRRRPLAPIRHFAAQMNEIRLRLRELMDPPHYRGGEGEVGAHPSRRIHQGRMRTPGETRRDRLRDLDPFVHRPFPRSGRAARVNAPFRPFSP